jgi:hypothetical protein
MRNRVGVGVLIVALVIAFNSVSAQTFGAPHYTHSELRKMIQEAHTEQQYKILASYFRSQQQTFEQQAQAEKVEWDRRSQNVTGPAAKYPRPVDSSKNRYEYFTYEARQMNKQATHYESLSDKAQ